jgi:Fe-S-cluster containining protein
MNEYPNAADQWDDLLRPMADRLRALYAAMDAGYAKHAQGLGFVCEGCRDNCCYTRFYHHTWLESMVLLRAVGGLTSSRRTPMVARAREVIRKSAQADEKGDKVRLMCPLNIDDRCTLYAVRPMICRLHGIPHELRRPDGRVIRGPGCTDFAIRCGQNGAPPLDRTPYYRQLAALEREFKEAIGTATRIKLTIAEMLTADSGPLQGWRQGNAA